MKLTVRLPIFAVSWAIILFANLSFAKSEDPGKQLIEKKCTSCHKFKGKAESRFTLKAPDLMWGGSKFQKKWLIDYLMGKKSPVYKQGYRWDQVQKARKHLMVTEKEAVAIAGYFKKALKDPRVKPNALDLSRFSEMEAALGEKIFKDHSCISCHQIQEDGKSIGGSQSTSFHDAGNRLNVDWVYRFNIKPPDFVPHSGEFEADVSELGLRYVTGYIMTLGVEEFKFYEPWNDSYFKKADSKRGGLLYKEYCAQCHGFSGKGDGPAAKDLTPKPAVHAQMAINKEPLDYLFNVIYYGGRNVGKSALMPYWGLTLGHQGVADVITYMRQTFTGQETVATAKTRKRSAGALGTCPQVRKTRQAPPDIREMKNPLEPTPKNLKKGKILFLRKAKPLACKHCHGLKGNGKGYKAVNMIPPPRNFTCAETMEEITDGQMYWIIKNGSKDTEMQAYDKLKDTQIWQLVLYLREFVK